MKFRTGIALIFLVLTLSLTTATLIQQNSQAPAWTLTQTTAFQQPNPKSITVTWGNETQANTYTTNAQRCPSVCCRPDGLFVVAWQSDGQDLMSWGVYTKLFGLTGQNLTYDIQVNYYNIDFQADPSVRCRSDGSFVVVWDSYGQDGDSYGVYAKIFNSAGGNTTEEILVNTYTANDQAHPSVRCRSDDSFVVAWMSGEQDGDGSGVYVKLFNSTGGNTTDDIKVNAYTASHQSEPSVCCRSDGSFVVAWQSDGQDGDGDGVYAKIFNSTGGNTTGDIKVNTYTANDQQYPSVRCRSDGSFVVAWMSREQDGDGWGVYAKIFNSTGGNTTGDIPVNTYTANDQLYPSVCRRSDDSFVVVWQSGGQDGSGWGVYAKIFNSAGVNMTGDIRVNTETANGQCEPSVCCRSDGSFVVAWASFGQDGSSYGVYFRIGSLLAPPTDVFSLFAAFYLMQSASGVGVPLLVGGGLVAAVVVVGVLGFWLWKRRA